MVDPRFEAQDSTVLPVSEDQQTQAYATLVSAVFEDPVERWLYPAPQEYRTHLPEFLAAFGGKAFQHDTVWKLGEFSAVALWLPPGIEADGNAITAVLAETVNPSKHDDLFSVLEQMDAAHPRDAHWYLPWFGVTAELGRGLGGTLMTHCLSVVDASHLPAYLETPSRRTITFYERHGFAVTGEASWAETAVCVLRCGGCRRLLAYAWPRKIRRTLSASGCPSRCRTGGRQGRRRPGAPRRL